MNSYPVVAALLAAAFVPFATAQTSPGPPRYITLPYHSSLTVGTSVGTGASVPTIPMWQATDAGYTFQMVGANPMITGSNSTTAIPTNIIPLVLTFSDGNVFDPTVANACSPAASAQSLVLASPLLNNSAYTSGTISGGTTQYIDFFQRAAFWRYTGPSGINPNYHVLLSPLPGAAVHISVPAASGRTVQTGCGRLGEMDINWFDEYVDNTLIPQLAGAGVAPNTYPVFVLNNTVMYDTSTSNCCIIGYHSASNNPSYSNQVQTYTVADFDTSGSFGSNRDTAALSHEVGEWLNDPLGNNPTPSWGHLGQVSGCQSNLEVGDPLSGTELTVVMPNAYSYHVQEMAFKSWFYRDVPSSGVNGWYSSNGTFKTPAAACDSSVTTLAISPTTIAAGSTASVTVTVAAGSGYSGTPSGTVALVSGATHATIATLTLSAGHASGAVAFPAGSYNVTANYSGDPNFAVSSSAAVAMTVGSPAINLNPASLTFGSQNTGTVSAAQSVVLTNQGTAPVTMSSVSITGSNPSDFAQTNNCGTSVAVGGSCTISVTFKPTAAGTRGASLSIADNVAGSPQTAPLTGTGTSTSVVSTVVFVKSDTTTQGNWHGIYGADGYNVIGDLASNPSYAAPVPATQFSYTWSASTSDGRALQKASNPSDRIAATWYSGSSFTIDLNTTDQASHQVALYCLDWDSNGRRETVDVLDPSGAVLNTQTLNSGFTGGVYLVWNISGRVILRVTNTAGGSNAVVSGLFFGSAAPIVPATGTATFVRTDTATQGNWPSTYGKDGYSVIGDTAVNPAYVTPLPTGQYSYTWAAFDRRSPRSPEGLESRRQDRGHLVHRRLVHGRFEHYGRPDPPVSRLFPRLGPHDEAADTRSARWCRKRTQFTACKQF